MRSRNCQGAKDLCDRGECALWQPRQENEVQWRSPRHLFPAAPTRLLKLSLRPWIRHRMPAGRRSPRRRWRQSGRSWRPARTRRRLPGTKRRPGLPAVRLHLRPAKQLRRRALQMPARHGLPSPNRHVRRRRRRPLHRRPQSVLLHVVPDPKTLRQPRSQGRLLRAGLALAKSLRRKQPQWIATPRRMVVRRMAGRLMAKPARNKLRHELPSMGTSATRP